MKVFLSSDWHLGVRSNSMEWFNSQLDYLQDVFLVYLKDNHKPGDVFIFIGDLFDSRQSINLTVMCKTIDLFESISKVISVIIIPGNHDVARTTDNNISSLDCLRFIPNVTIYKQPTELNLGSRKILLMPWMHSLENEKYVLGNTESNIVFAHADFAGASFDGVRDVFHGIKETDLSKTIERVYSGHIHHRQIKGKLNVIGTPYQLTRTDAGNEKGFWVIDFDNMDEHFIQNNDLPKFIKLTLDENILDSFDGVKNICLNNRVDLYVETKLFNKKTNSFIKQLRLICKTLDVFTVDSYDEVDDISYINRLDIKASYGNLINNKFDSELGNRLLNKFNQDFTKYEK